MHSSLWLRTYLALLGCNIAVLDAVYWLNPFDNDVHIREARMRYEKKRGYLDLKKMDIRPEITIVPLLIDRDMVELGISWTAMYFDHPWTKNKTCQYFPYQWRKSS